VVLPAFTSRAPCAL